VLVGVAIELVREDVARQRLRGALLAHVQWIDTNSLAYRAVLLGGVGVDPDIRAIVDDHAPT